MHCCVAVAVALVSDRLTGDLCPRTRFSLAEILVMDGAAGAGRMAPAACTRISARLKRVQRYVCREDRG